MDAYNVALPRDGGTLDLIAVKDCHTLANAWWVYGYQIKPHPRYVQVGMAVKEHQACYWFEQSFESAINVVRIRAWYTDAVCQAYAVDYCEMRLTPEDITEIERRVNSYYDIPF